MRDIADAELKRFPVEQVSWDDAQLFLERLNKGEKEAGWVYRLPKAAEWEYACRGGPLSDKFVSAYDFYFDKPTNHLLPEQANFAHGKGLKRTCKVGSYQPNRLGLYDMHGNVAEWCHDNRDDCRRGLAWGGPERRLVPRLQVGPGGAAAYALRTSRRDFNLGLRVARVPVGKDVVKNPPEEKKPADVVPVTPAVGPKPDVATTAPKFSGRPFLVRGDWTIENDELVQPTLASSGGGNLEEFPLVVLGEPTLSNYDLTLEAKKTGGRNNLGIFFHWLGPGHHRIFMLAVNGWINFENIYNGKWARDNAVGLRYSSNRWYSLKVEVRSDTCRAYLDGVLQFEQPPDARFTNGRICLFTDNATARFRRIKVSDPQGNVLFEGLPDLPPASNNTTPKANNGPSSRLLTAGETVAKSAQKQWAELLEDAGDFDEFARDEAGADSAGGVPDGVAQFRERAVGRRAATPRPDYEAVLCRRR